MSNEYERASRSCSRVEIEMFTSQTILTFRNVSNFLFSEYSKLSHLTDIRVRVFGIFERYHVHLML